MTAADLDLTAAIAAAAHAVHVAIAHDGTTPPYCGGPNDPQRDDAHVAVTAAAPVIERQVRERVAAEIEAAKSAVDQSIAAPGHYAGLGHAARIARGGEHQ